MTKFPCEKFIGVMLDEASKSPYRTKLGCIITRRNIIVSKGHNSRVTHPKSPTPLHAKHAEFHAITRLRGAVADSLYVIRIKCDGTFGTSKPCSHCMNLIAKSDIRNIWYFDNGWKLILR